MLLEYTDAAAGRLATTITRTSPTAGSSPLDSCHPAIRSTVRPQPRQTASITCGNSTQSRITVQLETDPRSAPAAQSEDRDEEG